jgi:hypothetical protein
MSKHAPFEVIELKSFDDLSRILYPQDYALLNSQENSHCWYFWHYYLSERGLSAKFAVIENDYISKDYLDSYRDYYASCFFPIERNCQRIHFFKADCDTNAFQKSLINAILNNDTDTAANFWEKGYLGFIVVKPIPQFSIGFTALKHYNYDIDGSLYKGSRNFWGVRKYDFNIFGQTISFETLPFQEQDTNLAACASIAIWIMLQIPSANNFIRLKSPGQITNDADLIANDGNRLFPNDGLVVNQMCTAITKSGLVTEYEEIGYYREVNTNSGVKEEYFFNDFLLKLLVRAYSSLQIPLILCIEVPEKDDDGEISFEGHAVAICGHEEADNQILDNDIQKMKTIFFAERIKKLYVHDDDFGPFARMEFKDDGLASAWGTNLETGVYDKAMPCRPESLIVSLYPEIRVRYSTVHNVVLIFDTIFKLSLDHTPLFEWDIRLQKHDKWKEEFKAAAIQNNLSDNYKLKVLTTQLPKYVWVANCKKEDTIICEILFDTTAMKNSMLAMNMVFYKADFEALVCLLVTEQENYDILSTNIIGYNRQYLLFLKKFFESNKKSPFWYSRVD